MDWDWAWACLFALNILIGMRRIFIEEMQDEIWKKHWNKDLDLNIKALLISGTERGIYSKGHKFDSKGRCIHNKLFYIDCRKIHSFILRAYFSCCSRFSRIRCTCPSIFLSSSQDSVAGNFRCPWGLMSGTLQCCTLPDCSCSWNRCLGYCSIAWQLQQDKILGCWIDIAFQSSSQATGRHCSWGLRGGIHWCDILLGCSCCWDRYLGQYSILDCSGLKKPLCCFAAWIFYRILDNIVFFKRKKIDTKKQPHGSFYFRRVEFDLFGFG